MVEKLFCNDCKDIHGFFCKVVGLNGTSRIVREDIYGHLWQTQMTNLDDCPYKPPPHVQNLNAHYGKGVKPKSGHTDSSVFGLLQQVINQNQEK
ncbi:MAG: hypothetical protein Q7R43_01245 [Candidatus Daviesbacteria bacterium]|nr:hypothetical protein [Candidatus Daviesbacteria bacterium]